ncbi:PilZ domain-containing protein [Sphingomonas japonica]|uniref:PilZ domain-containing protein n=1 Tax=Sphingomonas japonica TaxID=511662 RepID=A0ABX0U3Q2_9SPHN|nr:PilZ domain-containing protein [Sphingomonas japonica]NIJ25214.1 hypothetical protein [Sphingomonas japonica]
MELFRSRFTQTTVNARETIPAERRRAKRTSVFLQATVYPIDVFSEAWVHDVSMAGLKGETDVELAVGQTLHVTTDEKAYHTGVVKWTAGRLFGFSLPGAAAIFGQASDIIDHGDDEGHHPRPYRIDTDLTARLLGGRAPRPATVRNLSSGGMLIETSPGLLPGQHLVVRIGNSPAIYGRVQWRSANLVGLRSDTPISVPTLRHVVD